MFSIDPPTKIVYSLAGPQNTIELAYGDAPFNVQTTIHSFHMQARLCAKSFKLGSTSTKTSRCTQVGFQRGRGTKSQTANIHWIMEKAREFQKKSTSPSLTIWITTNWKILKEIAIPDDLLSPEKTVFGSRSNETGMKQWTGSKLRKGVQDYIVTCLTYT